jgi:hypothetical protein
MFFLTDQIVRLIPGKSFRIHSTTSRGHVAQQLVHLGLTFCDASAHSHLSVLRGNKPTRHREETRVQHLWWNMLTVMYCTAAVDVSLQLPAVHLLNRGRARRRRPCKLLYTIRHHCTPQPSTCARGATFYRSTWWVPRIRSPAASDLSGIFCAIDGTWRVAAINRKGSDRCLGSRRDRGHPSHVP